MESIYLEDHPDLHNYYYYSEDLDFAFCSKEKKGGRADLLTQFAQCRETVAGELFARFSDNYNDRRFSFIHLIKRIPLDKICIALRVVYGIDPYEYQRRVRKYNKIKAALDDMDGYMESKISIAAHILNVIGDKYGWEKTEVKKAILTYNGKQILPHHNSKMTVAYITGDPRWMRSPHILSLFLLLLRLPFYATSSLNTLSKAKTLDTLMKAFSTARGRSDGTYVRLAAKYIPMLFENFDEIFSKNIKDNYNPDNYKERYNSYWGDYSNYVTEGISTLCRGKSTNPRIAKAFAVLSKDSRIVMEVAAKADGC
jgi:hypothetical protein